MRVGLNSGTSQVRESKNEALVGMGTWELGSARHMQVRPPLRWRALLVQLNLRILSPDPSLSVGPARPWASYVDSAFAHQRRPASGPPREGSARSERRGR